MIELLLIKWITLSFPSVAFSAPPLSKSHREGNSPLSSPARLSSKITLSPGTKSYLDHNLQFCLGNAELFDVLFSAVASKTVFQFYFRLFTLFSSSFPPPFLTASAVLLIPLSIAVSVSSSTFFSIFFSTLSKISNWANEAKERDEKNG